jgi:hypothetical protein
LQIKVQCTVNSGNKYFFLQFFKYNRVGLIFVSFDNYRKVVASKLIIKYFLMYKAYQQMQHPEEVREIAVWQAA